MYKAQYSEDMVNLKEERDKSVKETKRKVTKGMLAKSSPISYRQSRSQAVQPERKIT